MLFIFINAFIAQFMFIAATIESICIFTIYTKTYTAFLADHFHAIHTMLPRNSTITFFCIKSQMLVTEKTM